MNIQLNAVSLIKEHLINNGFTELNTISCGDKLLVRSQLEYRDKMKIVECVVDKEGLVSIVMSENNIIMLTENNISVDGISKTFSGIPKLLFEEKK